MPWVEPTPDQIFLQSPMGVEMGPEPKAPSLGAVTSSAFSRENLVVNMARKLSEERNPIDHTYNPMSDERVKGGKYESQYAERFTYAYSRKDADRIIADIEREERDDEVLSAGGAVGFGASVVAGMLDPTVLLPGGAIYRASKGGYSLVKTGMATAAAGTAQAALYETGMQLSQDGRTAKQSIVNIGSSALLSGFYGARVTLG